MATTGVLGALGAVVEAVDTAAAALLRHGAAGRATEGQEALEAVRLAMTLVGRLEAITAGLLPVVEADGLWALDGARSLAQWVSSVGRVPHARAAALVRTGRAFRDVVPATAAAAVAGEVGMEAARAIAAAANTPVRAAALQDEGSSVGEGFLLAQARDLPVGSFRRLVSRWTASVDPEADERGFREVSEREFLDLSATTGGYHVSGFLSEENGMVVRDALAAVTGVPAADDERTSSQRRARALVDLARLTLDHGLAGSSGEQRPHLSVVVDWETLQRAVMDGSATGDRHEDGHEDGDERIRSRRGSSGRSPCWSPGAASSQGEDGKRHGSCLSGAPSELVVSGDVERFGVGELVGGRAVPASVLARLACDSVLSRVVFGPRSEIIDVGRSQRTFSGPRRRAVVARDGRCRFPGCDAPPALCEVHHVRHWARDGGDTDADEGVLLCWHHHARVHTLGIEIVRRGGRWHFTDRHGDPLTGARRRTTSRRT